MQRIKRYLETGEYDSASKLLNDFLKISKEELCELLYEIKQKPIVAAEIPQYSSFDDGSYRMIEFLRMSGNFGPTFIEVGKHYLKTNRQKVAYTKYGENHSKLSEMLGVTTIRKEGGKRRVYLNHLGFELENRSFKEQEECFTKLAVRIPVVQYALKQKTGNAKELEGILKNYLSDSTALRRRGNTWYLISKLREEE